MQKTTLHWNTFCSLHQTTQAKKQLPSAPFDNVWTMDLSQWPAAIWLPFRPNDVQCMNDQIVQRTLHQIYGSGAHTPKPGTLLIRSDHNRHTPKSKGWRVISCQRKFFLFDLLLTSLLASLIATGVPLNKGQKTKLGSS